MKKNLFILTLILFSFLEVTAQKLSLEKLKNYLHKETDVIAEELLQKGYEFSGSDKDVSFQKGTGNENFSIDLKREFSNYVQICSSGKYNYLYTPLETEIKAKSKKIKFFYSPWLKTYITEYLYKDKFYIYLGQGVCQTLDLKKMKFIQVSAFDLKKELFLYEQ